MVERDQVCMRWSMGDGRASRWDFREYCRIGDGGVLVVVDFPLHQARFLVRGLAAKLVSVAVLCYRGPKSYSNAPACLQSSAGSCSSSLLFSSLLLPLPLPPPLLLLLLFFSSSLLLFVKVNFLQQQQDQSVVLASSSRLGLCRWTGTSKPLFDSARVPSNSRQTLMAINQRRFPVPQCFRRR